MMARRRRLFLALVLLTPLVALLFAAPGRAAVTLGVTSTTAGPSPFISILEVTASRIVSLESVKFTIRPKPGSVTRPVSATYSIDYLKRRGYLDVPNDRVTVPVFGLYANYENSVDLVYGLAGGVVVKASTKIQTDPFADPTDGQVYLNPTVVQARSHRKSLSYDFILVKNFASANTPLVLDTDGEVRWAGTSGNATQNVAQFDNAFYLLAGTSLIRQEFDGAFATVVDYGGIGVTGNHHQIDPGKYGIILDVDMAGYTEAVNLEVDAAGVVLKMWNLAEIVGAAMREGGDDPSAFVRPGDDWFHNNAVTYRRSDDSVIMSSRENFVICVDYSTNKIKWILGDPSKAWHDYPSLRRYALTLATGSQPPIGQHAVSISGDNLLLFDDGANSFNQSPAGDNRDYSACRKYRIDTRAMRATEIWNYTADRKIYSPYCSSVYEDRPRNYLVDYAIETDGTTELVGLDSRGAKAFDYKYTTQAFCGTSWNALPIHWESLKFR